MKKSIRFLCWLLIGAMFCAVSLGGCGGHDDNLSVSQNEQGSTGGDTTNGRGDGWDDFEDLGFEVNVTGKWRIADTYMILGSGEDLYSELGVTDFQLTATGSTLSISTLDGQQAPFLQTDFEGYDTVQRKKLTAKGIAVLAGGTYSLVSADTYKQTVDYWSDNDQNYYTLEGRKKSGSASSKWDSLKFTNVYINGDAKSANSFTVTTILVPIESNPADDFEVLDSFELFSGNWKVVSSQLSIGPANTWDLSYNGKFYFNKAANKYLKSRAGNGKLLFAPYNPEYPSQQVAWSDDGLQEAEFVYVEEDNSDFSPQTVTIMMNAGGYEQDSQKTNLYSTPMFDQNGNYNAKRQTIEGIGSYPWPTVEVTYGEYDSKTRRLIYKVVTTLENTSY